MFINPKYNTSFYSKEDRSVLGIGETKMRLYLIILWQLIMRSKQTICLKFT